MCVRSCARRTERECMCMCVVTEMRERVLFVCVFICLYVCVCTCACACVQLLTYGYLVGGWVCCEYYCMSIHHKFSECAVTFLFHPPSITPHAQVDRRRCRECSVQVYSLNIHTHTHTCTHIHTHRHIHRFVYDGIG